MFSFFKKKKDPFTVRIKEYEQPRFVAGMQTPTAKRSYRKDVSALQTSFNGKRDQLQNRTVSEFLLQMPNEDDNRAARAQQGDRLSGFFADKREQLTVIISNVYE